MESCSFAPRPSTPPASSSAVGGLRSPAPRSLNRKSSQPEKIVVLGRGSTRNAEVPALARSPERRSRRHRTRGRPSYGPTHRWSSGKSAPMPSPAWRALRPTASRPGERARLPQLERWRSRQHRAAGIRRESTGTAGGGGGASIGTTSLRVTRESASTSATSYIVPWRQACVPGEPRAWNERCLLENGVVASHVSAQPTTTAATRLQVARGRLSTREGVDGWYARK